MGYVLHVEPHPIGVIVRNDDGMRELLIEGESCCGLDFDELKIIASSTGKIEVDESKLPQCRLK